MRPCTETVHSRRKSRLPVKHGAERYLTSLHLILLIMAVLPGSRSLAASVHGFYVEVTAQSITYVYGESISFTVSAQNSQPITAVYLTVETNEGERLYEPARITPGNAVLATHIVSADRLGLGPTASITYHWEFASADGQTSQTEPQQFIYADNTVPWDWHPEADRQMVAYFNGIDQTIADTVIETGTRAIAQTSHLIGISIDQPITIYLYPDLFMLTSALELHEVGFSRQDTLYINPTEQTALVSYDSPENLAYDVSRAVVTTLLSAATGYQNPKIPFWLSTGLVGYVAGSRGSNQEQLFFSAYQNNELIPIHSLCQPTLDGFSQRDVQIATVQSTYLLSHLVDRFGPAALRAFVSELVQGQSCEAAFINATDITLTQYEMMWKTYIAEERLSMSTQDTLVPWILVGAVSLALSLLFIAPQPIQLSSTAYEAADPEQTAGYYHG